MRSDALVFTAHTTGATAGGTPNDELTVEFTGQGVQAYDYLVSPSEFHSGWHHIALVKDAQSGNQSVWIDGVCSNTMHSMGNATGSHLTPTSGGITLNSRNAVGFDASVDEIALCVPPINTAMPLLKSVRSTVGTTRHSQDHSSFCTTSRL